jgi:hypothetical protein
MQGNLADETQKEQHKLLCKYFPVNRARQSEKKS